MIARGAWLKGWFTAPDWRRTTDIAAEVDEEFAFHVEQLQAGFEADGASPAAAAALAAAQFGDRRRLQKECVQIIKGGRIMLLRAAVVLVLSAAVMAGGYAALDDGERFPKLSPFSGVRWSGWTPEVLIDGTWYRLESIDGIPVGEIVAHCQSSYPGIERKRFSEDLPEVLAGLHRPPAESVNLALVSLDDGERVLVDGVPMTKENRQQVWRRNHDWPERGAPAGGFARLAPFSGVRWNAGGVEVCVDEVWYGLDAVDGVATDDILAHCRHRYPGREHKRLSEDLVEVMAGLGQPLAASVQLAVRDLQTGATMFLTDVPLTHEKRQAALRYNHAAAVPDAAPPGAVVRLVGDGPAGMWERYTRAFIRRYQLDDGQEQRAWAILRNCQARGRRYLETHRARFDALEQRAVALGVASAAKGPEAAAIRREAGRLQQPIDDIFERELKPRLERLLTRAQRALGQPDAAPEGPR